MTIQTGPSYEERLKQHEYIHYKLLGCEMLPIQPEKCFICWLIREHALLWPLQVGKIIR